MCESHGILGPERSLIQWTLNWVLHMHVGVKTKQVGQRPTSPLQPNKSYFICFKCWGSAQAFVWRQKRKVLQAGPVTFVLQTKMLRMLTTTDTKNVAKLEAGPGLLVSRFFLFRSVQQHMLLKVAQECSLHVKVRVTNKYRDSLDQHCPIKLYGVMEMF